MNPNLRATYGGEEEKPSAHQAASSVPPSGGADTDLT